MIYRAIIEFAAENDNAARGLLAELYCHGLIDRQLERQTPYFTGIPLETTQPNPDERIKEFRA